MIYLSSVPYQNGASSLVQKDNQSYNLRLYLNTVTRKNQNYNLFNIIVINTSTHSQNDKYLQQNIEKIKASKALQRQINVSTRNFFWTHYKSANRYEWR